MGSEYYCDNNENKSAIRYQSILEQRFLDEVEELKEKEPDELEKLEPVPSDTPEELQRKKLVREQKEESLHRQEEAARTQKDFEDIIEKWNKIDANRERRERYNEILRSDIPIDFGCSYLPDLKIYPKYMNSTVERQLMRGDFLDFIYDCPYEMHDLTSIRYARNIVNSLKDEHKEFLYFYGIKNFKINRIAEMRGQSDRNIRRTRQVVYGKIWNKAYAELYRREQKGFALSDREKRFMRGYEEGTLVMDNDD